MTTTARRRTLAVCAALLGLAALSAGASAQSAAQKDALRAHCRNDFMARCAGVTPGGKAALGCLQKNVARLSPGCRKAVSATMRTAPPAARAPAAAARPAQQPPEHHFVRGGVLIQKACLRTILMHCRGMGLDMGRKVACLVDYANAGHFVGVRCKAALRMSGHLR